ncbi:MAG: elongation factor Ts [Kiritimatiellaeota bacterium]|nr:elongation factor Ts [Kiritimatiellota bacterium]
MANITAAMVKELRDKTDAGMMDCKKALVEADGDMGKAVDVLRKSGIAKAEKKSGRTVKEGKIVANVDGATGVLVEALCETDFVATNDKFIEYVDEVTAKIAAMDADGDVSAEIAESEKDNLTALIATIGENMRLRRAIRWSGAGKCAAYIHGGGRIGVMIQVEGEADDEALNDVCMHIAAFKPAYTTPDDIPAEVIAKEREIGAGQVEGKPAGIIDKIVNGKINKWYKEVCLTRQPWIRDDKQTVEKANPGLEIKRFIRWEIGEEL